MIQLKPVTDVRPGDVLSTDGYAVTAVVRLQGGGAPDEIMVATVRGGHEKAGCFAPDATLPICVDSDERIDASDAERDAGTLFRHGAS